MMRHFVARFAAGLAPLKGLVISTLIVALQAAAASGAARIELSGYQSEDGAISVFFQGDSIDPYFATKALLAAQQAGADVTAPALDWVRWLLPRQHEDGTFRRYCRRNDAYDECAETDADDALLAVWIELLIKVSPAPRMPDSWARSVDIASRHLLGLRDSHTGIYHISARLPVALLMDNVEVFTTLRSLADWHKAQGNIATARRWQKRQSALAASIERVFRLPGGSYRASTQIATLAHFYPDRVAQLYPLIGGLPFSDSRPAYDAWLQQNLATWIAQAQHDFPWGLAALAADRVNDHQTVACWLVHAQPYRRSQAQWNVLEESLFQAFSANNQALPTCPWQSGNEWAKSAAGPDFPFSPLGNAPSAKERH